MDSVHMILARVRAVTTSGKYTVGDVRPCMIYTAGRSDEEPDLEKIEHWMADRGWNVLEVMKSARTDEEQIEGEAETSVRRKSFFAAREAGISFIIYEGAE